MLQAKDHIPAVQKAARLLKAIAELNHPTGVSELARLTGTHKSTVSRILDSLEAEGLVSQDPLTQKFSPGPTFWRLAASNQQRGGLAVIARPHLLQLQTLTQETTNLCIFDGQKAITIDYCESQHLIAHREELARISPCHCTAAGKVLLAFQPDDVIARVLTPPLERFTSATLLDVDAIRHELEQIRTDDVGTAINERESGLAEVAVPIRDAAGRVKAALGVLGPTSRLTAKRRKRIGELALGAAQAILSQGGHRPRG